MEKLKTARNMILIVGIIVCFSALGKNPNYGNGIEVGSGLMFVGLILEAIRTAIIWTPSES